MPLYPPDHSTFEVSSPPPDAPEVAEGKQASAASVKGVYLALALVVVSLLIITFVLGHIPSD